MTATRWLLVAATLAVVGCGSAPQPRPAPTSAARFNAEGLRRLERGDLAGAEGMLRDALREAELVDDLPGQAEAFSNLGALAAQKGDAEGALAMHLAALRAHLAAGAGSRGEARARTNVGGALMALGRRDEAKTEFTRAIAVSDALSDPKVALTARVGLATLALSTSPEEAERLAKTAVALARQEGDDAALASALVAEGVAIETRGDRATAKERYLAALLLDKKREDPTAVADDLSRLSRVEELLGKRDEAASLSARRSRVLRRMGRLDDATQAMARAAALAKGTEQASYQAELDALKSAQKPDAPPQPR